MGLLLSGVLAVTVLLAGTASASDEELLEQVRVGMYHRYTSVTTCKGSVHLVMTRPMEGGERLFAVRVVTATFDGQRLRMSGKVTWGQADNFEGAFDGEKTTEWVGECMSAPLVYDGLDGISDGEFSLFVDPRRIGGWAVTSLDPRPEASANIVGREAVDGNDCVVLEYTSDVIEGTDGGRSRVRYWVDAERGFSVPKLLASWIPGDEAEPVLLRDQVVELRQYGDEVWGPATFIRVDYRPDGTVEKKVYGTYDPGFEINVPISEDDLTLRLPAGMAVRDHGEGAPDEVHRVP